MEMSMPKRIWLDAKISYVKCYRNSHSQLATPRINAWVRTEVNSRITMSKAAKYIWEFTEDKCGIEEVKYIQTMNPPHKIGNGRNKRRQNICTIQLGIKFGNKNSWFRLLHFTPVCSHLSIIYFPRKCTAYNIKLILFLEEVDFGHWTINADSLNEYLLS